MSQLSTFILIFLMANLAFGIFVHKEVDPNQHFCMSDDIRTSLSIQQDIR